MLQLQDGHDQDAVVMAIIAFDCDGTLLSLQDNPIHKNIQHLLWYINNGDRVIVWSGGGRQYAETIARRVLGNVYLEKGLIICSMKNKEQAEKLKPDICYDDEFVELAKVNVKV